MIKKSAKKDKKFSGPSFIAPILDQKWYSLLYY